VGHPSLTTDRKAFKVTHSPKSTVAIQSYSAYQIGLHWLIAALVLVQLVFGESMTALIEAIEEGDSVSSLDNSLAGLHYYSGIAILTLVAVRLALRLKTGTPPPPVSSRFVELTGRLAHWLFYVLLVVVPVMGLLGFYFGDPYGEIHTFAKPVFIGLIVLHVFASLYHQFWLKDGLLMRMIRVQPGS
jgi:cytochrome b561